MTRTQRTVIAAMTIVSNQQSALPYLLPWLAPMSILATPASAGTTTISVKNASGTTFNFDVVTDGSANLGAMGAICDGAALATCATLTGTSLNVNLTNTALVNPATLATWALGTTGSAVPANAFYNGAQARSSEPTAASNGNLTGMTVDLVGKAVTSPYANRENMLRAIATTNGTTAVTLLAPQGASVKTYVTGIQCGRSDTGTTAMRVTFSDTASTVLIIPNNGGGGGNNATLNIPLVTAANATLTFTPDTAVATTYCAVQAFTGY